MTMSNSVGANLRVAQKRIMRQTKHLVEILETQGMSSPDILADVIGDLIKAYLIRYDAYVGVLKQDPNEEIMSITK
jgi:S-adenosylmethionine synthetase